MATAEEYAAWIVQNKDKQGSPEFETVAQAYKQARAQASSAQQYDPTSGMSTYERYTSAIGKRYTDLTRGAQQMMLAPFEGRGVEARRQELTQEADEAKRLNAPLMNTTAGKWGDFTGSVTATAPAVMASPGYAGALLSGLFTGGLEPTGTGDSRASNMAWGGASSLVGQGIGDAAGLLLKPISSQLSPEAAALARGAEREGIPLTAGDLTGSRNLKLAESVLEDLPFTSGRQLAGREAQQRAFTAAALRRAGMVGDVADDAALLAQKKALGKTMEGIANAGQIDFNQGLSQKLAAIVADANDHNQAVGAEVGNTVKNIFAHLDQNGVMTGTHYQGWREPLRLAANEGGLSGHYASQIRKALDAEFSAQIGGAAGDQFKAASRQYANLKTIMEAAGGPGVKPAVGQLAPAQLSAALRNTMGKEGIATGQGDLNQLTRIGQTFVKDNLPNSYTANRQLMQRLLTGGANVLPGAAAGAGIGYYTGGKEGALYGAAGGAAANVALPRTIQSFMLSPAGKAYLTNGAIPLTESGREALSAALRSATTSETMQRRQK